MPDEIEEFETDTPFLGLTKDLVVETVAKAVIATIATAVTTVAIKTVSSALEARRNAKNDEV